MHQSTYTRWSPIPEFDGRRMYCEAVHDDWEGFRLWLMPDDRRGGMLVVSFDTVLHFANTPERFRLGRIDPDGMSLPHAFWTVGNSTLVSAFRRDACGTVDDLPITHYAFLTSNDCIDVLASASPKFVNSSK